MAKSLFNILGDQYSHGNGGQSKDMSKLKTAIIAGVMALLIEGFCVLCFMGVGEVGWLLSWIGIIFTYPAFLVSRLFQAQSLNVFFIVGYLQFFSIFWFIVKRYGQRVGERLSINRPVFWLIASGILVLLAIGGIWLALKLSDYAELCSNLWVSSFCVMMVGIFGMVASLVLCLLPGKHKTTLTEGQTLTGTRRKHYALFTILCLAHAVLLTAVTFHSLTNQTIGPLSVKECTFLLWTLFAAWPFWLFVFWMFDWRTSRIMITLMIGLLILSPIFFLILIGWSLAHGASLG